jgi:L-lactate dehydrogenase complex protein LldG
MTGSAKQEILNKLRRARSRAPLEKPALCFPEERGCEAVDIQRFKDLLNQNHAEVHETTEAGLIEAIRQWLTVNDTEQGVCVSDHPALSELKESLRGSVTLLDIAELDKTTLFNKVELSVCYAELGISDKGALLLEASAYQPRTLSLVPPANILVVKKNNITSDLESAFASTRFLANNLPSNIILISGPSKTADIQQTLAYGAHGPKQLVVFVIS